MINSYFIIGHLLLDGDGVCYSRLLGFDGKEFSFTKESFVIVGQKYTPTKSNCLFHKFILTSPTKHLFVFLLMKFSQYHSQVFKANKRARKGSTTAQKSSTLPRFAEIMVHIMDDTQKSLSYTLCNMMLILLVQIEGNDVRVWVCIHGYI